MQIMGIKPLNLKQVYSISTCTYIKTLFQAEPKYKKTLLTSDLANSTTL